MQDTNSSQIKIKVNGTLEKNEKITTKFEPSNDEDVLVRRYLDTKLAKVKDHKSNIKKIMIKLGILKDPNMMFQVEGLSKRLHKYFMKKFI